MDLIVERKIHVFKHSSRDINFNLFFRFLHLRILFVKRQRILRLIANGSLVAPTTTIPILSVFISTTHIVKYVAPSNDLCLHVIQI